MNTNQQSTYFCISAIIASLFAATPAANAVTLIADYSNLGTVYQDTAGNLYDAPGAGRADVTSLFQSNVSTAFTYLQNTVLLPWDHTVSFLLFPLVGADGDSLINSFDVNGRSSASTIRISTGFPEFIDPTPFDNSEFTLSYGTTPLGGGFVNNKRFGDAISGSGAEDKDDFLTLVLHETIHSLGISDNSQRFEDLVGPTGATPRTLTVGSAVSGLPAAFNIPVLAGSGHFAGDPATNDIFGFTTVSTPGWSLGQRALPTGLDILALGQVNGATPSGLNLNDSALAVPEPSTALLGAMGVLGLLCRRKRNERNA